MYVVLCILLRCSFTKIPASTVSHVAIISRSTKLKFPSIIKQEGTAPNCCLRSVRSTSALCAVVNVIQLGLMPLRVWPHESLTVLLRSSECVLYGFKEIYPIVLEGISLRFCGSGLQFERTGLEHRCRFLFVRGAGTVPLKNVAYSCL